MKIIQTSSIRPASASDPALAVALRDAGEDQVDRWAVHYWNRELSTYQVGAYFAEFGDAVQEYQACCTRLGVDSGWDALFVV